jgi:hypothetical protein
MKVYKKKILCYAWLSCVLLKYSKFGHLEDLKSLYNININISNL